VGRWWNRLLLLAIIGATVFSVIVVWPSEPWRYLPSQIDWPEGQGIKLKVPKVEGGTFEMVTIERRAMSLGLDLRGGTRLVLEPEEGVAVSDLDEALDGAKDVIERRVNAFGVAESEVNRLGDNRLSVQLPGIEPQEAIDKIGKTALLQFCEPVTNEGGQVAVAQGGTVLYEPQTCQPVLDASGQPTVEGGTVVYADWPGPQPADIIWKPAAAEIDGVERALSGEFLDTDRIAFQRDQITSLPKLVFGWNKQGADISEQVTTRLVDGNYPLAPFLDGEPIRGDDGQIVAPSVRGVITEFGEISGLSAGEARELETLLKTGAFPVPLRVVAQQNVDATLGETAVRNSVIAGEVALLLIMAFMVLYYRLPGVMAGLALIVYTSFVLAIFKLWPITLTLSGVAAFVLSVGMAVDANILIFERMKEELRVGRSLVSALEDGFTRAWSSIRDSNISTLITCAILYWFGDQFGESAIKGFAITLAIGVLVSMFSAIIVTRTFMSFVIGLRPISRRPWLFVADAPAAGRAERGRVPAIAGGADDDARRTRGKGR
jgi:preprotein translocase subunit SecD